jgi:hypothetical protein
MYSKLNTATVFITVFDPVTHISVGQEYFRDLKVINILDVMKIFNIASIADFFGGDNLDTPREQLYFKKMYGFKFDPANYTYDYQLYPPEGLYHPTTGVKDPVLEKQLNEEIAGMKTSDIYNLIYNN